jgi:hypothetical protein
MTRFYIFLAWLVAIILIVRVVIPGLVNLQNDGALVLALLIAAATLYGSHALYTFVKKEIP